LLEGPQVRRIELARLDEKSVGAIARGMLAMTRPPDAFLRVLSRLSEGNPFFVAEYLRAAVDERLLYREHGAWRVKDADAADEAVYESLPLPRSLRDLVRRRLGGLSKEAYTVVEVASVLGREVRTALLGRIAGLDEDAVAEAVRELVTRHV